MNSWEKKWTKTHLNALFVQALYDLPLVLRDDARFLHVAKCGESLLHLHVEASLTFRQEQESLLKCALEQSRVKDVKKSKELLGRKPTLCTSHGTGEEDIDGCS